MFLSTPPSFSPFFPATRFSFPSDFHIPISVFLYSQRGTMDNNTIPVRCRRGAGSLTCTIIVIVRKASKHSSLPPLRLSHLLPCLSNSTLIIIDIPTVTNSTENVLRFYALRRIIGKVEVPVTSPLRH